MLSILDTSVLIGPGNHDIEGEIAISAVSVAELQFGVLVTEDPDKRAVRLGRLSALLQHFDPLPVDSRVASSYGMLAAITHRNGRRSKARSLDLMIAATAHAHGAKLVTRNAADVEHLGSVLEIEVV